MIIIIEVIEVTVLIHVTYIDIEVRDVIFHPYMPLIFSSSDGTFKKKKMKTTCNLLTNR